MKKVFSLILFVTIVLMPCTTAFAASVQHDSDDASLSSNNGESSMLQYPLSGSNDFIIDLRLKTDIARAAETDDVANTVSYADVHEAVKEEMAIPSKLLEHVCGRIVKRLFHDFPAVESIDLKLSKRNPPMGADLDAAGVEVHCDR